MHRVFRFAGGALLALSLIAQTGQRGDWRQMLENLPAQPGSNVRAQDVDRLRGAIEQGTPYLLAANSNDYEANREMVRRIITYLAALEAMARDPEMRYALARTYRSVADLEGNPNGQSLGYRSEALKSYRRAGMLFGGLPRGRYGNRQTDRELETIGMQMALLGAPFAYPADPNAQAPRSGAEPPAAAQSAPFPLLPPDVQDVPAAEKAEYHELLERYTEAASQAASAWENVDGLRRTLAAQGMTLNTELAASLSRMQLYMQLASEGFSNRDWALVRENLERAVGQTTKVLHSVGR
jgi:hypothetical protein